MAHLVGQLDASDIGIIAGYFVIVIVVGLWSSCCNRGSVGGYFLAGRSMHWILVGASLFASNIGSGHFIGLAGAGAASGVAVAVFEISAVFSLVFLGWLFVPVYTKSGVFTMPEYLKKRFGGTRLQIYLACMALFLYIFTKISADLYAGAIFIDQALGLELYTAIIILLVISGMFTILGGLTAVIWTDFIQTILMFVGAIYLMVIAFVKVGGFDNLVRSYFNAIPNTTRVFQEGPVLVSSLNDSSLMPSFSTYTDKKYASCGIPPVDALHMFRPIDDHDLPWTGVVLGLTINGLWYWCTDQVIVQRTLSAKNLSHAKAGCLLAGIFKLLPLWLLVFPGMISRVLFPDEVGCADPQVCLAVCGKASGCTDIAYPRLVIRLLPPGAKGLMLAVMVASLVSSLTSIFNSSSTLFTMDIWRRIRPQARSAELMVVGRVSTLVLILISVAWIPVVKSSSELFHYIQSVTSYLSPPVCAVFLLAIFWTRCNELGAFWALIVGLVIGLIRFAWESVYPRSACGAAREHTTAEMMISSVHYLHFSVILFLICCAVAYVVSLVSQPLPESHTNGLTFWSRHRKIPLRNLNMEPPKELSVPSGYLDEKRRSSQTNRQNYAIPKPWYLRAAYWVCGIEQETAGSREEMNTGELTLSIEEDAKWSLATQISAMFLVLMVSCMWGFFA
ncbi:unnamed protein product [Calicophoron daubneyi]|uniref:Sodium/glucose cotransporter 4 n=1 Tax=Calicophoron daubneyi TaxID=300641 RepID=A0AAV2T9D9_CALDB